MRSARHVLWVVPAVVLSLAVWPALAQVEGPLVYLSPDGSDRFRPVIDLGETVSVLADIDSITPPALSPNETAVAFSGAVGDESLGRYAIFTVGVDGSGLTQLTTGTEGEFDPAWSPDGTAIAASQNSTGSLNPSSCCRLIEIDVQSASVTVLTADIGAARPSYTQDGSTIVFDTPAGVSTIPSAGGSPTRISTGGYDPSPSPDGNSVAYLFDTATGTELRRVPIGGGIQVTLYSTSGELENPFWENGRIYFVEHRGLGYDGRKQVEYRSVPESGGASRVDHAFSQRAVGVNLGKGNDEIFFYRGDGEFRFYEIEPDGTLPSPLLGGSGYTSGWSSIAAVDLDGDSQDEMFFYRGDGLFRYYHVRRNGALPGPLLAGSAYTSGWSIITGIDLDGDGQDEMFFYRATDGLFRYYHVRSDGTLPSPLLAGSGYTPGWTSVAALDLEGDGQDEILFYRDDGLFRVYHIRPNGSLGSPIQAGNSYPVGLSSVSSLDLDGDGLDELLFYTQGGDFTYYDVLTDGRLGEVILQGNSYTGGWEIIIGIDLGPG